MTRHEPLVHRHPDLIILCLSLLLLHRECFGRAGSFDPCHDQQNNTEELGGGDWEGTFEQAIDAVGPTATGGSTDDHWKLKGSLVIHVEENKDEASGTIKSIEGDYEYVATGVLQSKSTHIDKRLQKSGHLEFSEGTPRVFSVLADGNWANHMIVTTQDGTRNVDNSGSTKKARMFMFTVKSVDCDTATGTFLWLSFAQLMGGGEYSKANTITYGEAKWQATRKGSRFPEERDQLVQRLEQVKNHQAQGQSAGSLVWTRQTEANSYAAILKDIQQKDAHLRDCLLPYWSKYVRMTVFGWLKEDTQKVEDWCKAHKAMDNLKETAAGCKDPIETLLKDLKLAEFLGFGSCIQAAQEKAGTAIANAYYLQFKAQVLLKQTADALKTLRTYNLLTGHNPEGAEADAVQGKLADPAKEQFNKCKQEWSEARQARIDSGATTPSSQESAAWEKTLQSAKDVEMLGGEANLPAWPSDYPFPKNK